MKHRDKINKQTQVENVKQKKYVQTSQNQKENKDKVSKKKGIQKQMKEGKQKQKEGWEMKITVVKSNMVQKPKHTLIANTKLASKTSRNYKEAQSDNQRVKQLDNQISRSIDPQQLRRRLEMKSNRLLMKTKQESMVSIDRETEHQIRQFLQDQIEEVVATFQKEMNLQNQWHEQQIKTLTLQQNQSFNRILKLNQHRSFSQVQELKRQINNLRTQLRDIESNDSGQVPDSHNCTGLIQDRTMSSYEPNLTHIESQNQSDLRKPHDTDYFPKSGTLILETNNGSNTMFRSMSAKYPNLQSFPQTQGGSYHLQRIQEDQRATHKVTPGTSQYIQSPVGRINEEIENFEDSYDLYENFKETPNSQQPCPTQNRLAINNQNEPRALSIQNRPAKSKVNGLIQDKIKKQIDGNNKDLKQFLTHQIRLQTPESLENCQDARGSSNSRRARGDLSRLPKSQNFINLMTPQDIQSQPNRHFLPQSLKNTGRTTPIMKTTSQRMNQPPRSQLDNGTYQSQTHNQRTIDSNHRIKESFTSLSCKYPKNQGYRNISHQMMDIEDSVNQKVPRVNHLKFLEREGMKEDESEIEELVPDENNFSVIQTDYIKRVKGLDNSGNSNSKSHHLHYRVTRSILSEGNIRGLDNKSAAKHPSSSAQKSTFNKKFGIKADTDAISGPRNSENADFKHNFIKAAGVAETSAHKTSTQKNRKILFQYESHGEDELSAAPVSLTSLSQKSIEIFQKEQVFFSPSPTHKIVPNDPIIRPSVLFPASVQKQAPKVNTPSISYPDFPETEKHTELQSENHTEVQSERKKREEREEIPKRSVDYEENLMPTNRSDLKPSAQFLLAKDQIIKSKQTQLDRNIFQAGSLQIVPKSLISNPCPQSYPIGGGITGGIQLQELTRCVCPTNTSPLKKSLEKTEKKNADYYQKVVRKKRSKKQILGRVKEGLEKMSEIEEESFSRSCTPLNNQGEKTFSDDGEFNLSNSQVLIEDNSLNPNLFFCSQFGINPLGRDGNNKVCGKFCNNLTPEMERAIVIQTILQMITNYLKQTKQFQLTKDSHGKASQQFQRQISLITHSEVIDYINSLSGEAINLCLVSAAENDKRYLISAQWWREWCDYTNFENKQIFQFIQNQTDGEQQTFNENGPMSNRSFYTQKQKTKKISNQSICINQINEMRQQDVLRNENESGGKRVKSDRSYKDKFSNQKSDSSSEKMGTDSALRREKGFKEELQRLKAEQRLKGEKKDCYFQTHRNHIYYGRTQDPVEQLQDSPLWTNRTDNKSTVQSNLGSVIYQTNQFGYKRPGFIRNAVLLKEDQIPNKERDQQEIQQMPKVFISLRADLIEHFDYEAVPYDLWKLLKQWYNSDTTLLRFLKMDKVYNQGQLYLDLYPEQRANQFKPAITQKNLKDLKTRNAQHI